MDHSEAKSIARLFPQALGAARPGIFGSPLDPLRICHLTYRPTGLKLWEF